MYISLDARSAVIINGRKVYRRCELREERFVIKVVEMHFIQGMSQVEIAKKLGVSRTTISRTVAQARQRGYIEFKVNYPEGFEPATERAIEEEYNLREVIIATETEEKDMNKEVASYVSDYIVRTIKDKMTIAFSNGRVLYEVADAMKKDVRLKFLKVKDVEVVPLIPSYNLPTSTDEFYCRAYSNRSLDILGQLLNAHSYHLLIPPIVSSKEIREELLKEQGIKDVRDRTENADIAIAGIGTLDDDSAGILSGVVSRKEYQSLKESGAVAELLMHMVKKNGEIADEDFENRVTTIAMEQFKEIPIRIGVAYGMKKAEAIRAVLQGGLINVLVTDKEVAKVLLEEI